MSAPSQPGSTHISRQELYEKVWTVSMRKLAAEYGLSDVGLAKTCDRHEIPKPPVGYWAKHEVGKAPPRPPLPPASSPSLEQIPLSRVTSVSAPPAPPEPTDPEIVQMLTRARALVVQPTSPDMKLHPAAERTLRALEKSAKSNYPPDKGLFSPHWDNSPQCFEIHASPASFGRIVRILDALMRACDEMGMKTKTITEDRNSAGPHLELLSEHFRFYVRERVRQCPRQPKPNDRYSYHKHDYEPQGILELRLLKSGHYRHERTWVDRQRLKIEESLGEVIEAMVRAVDESRKARAAEKQRETERREAERIAEEKRRLRQEDLASVRNLLDQTERWHAAEAIRRYVAAVRAMVEAKDPIEPGGQAAEWLAWAARTADRLDPMTADKETGLELDVLYPPPEPRWNAYQQAEEVHRGRPTWLWSGG